MPDVLTLADTQQLYMLFGRITYQVTTMLTSLLNFLKKKMYFL